MSVRRALFLDRDGVINHRIVGGYITAPSEFRLDEGILSALRYAKDAGYLLVVITNQQGVGKGLMTSEDLDAVQAHMNQVLTSHIGFGVDRVYSCMSLASMNDPRRKPSPGMLLEAIDDMGIDPSESWFVGDSITDAQAGRAAAVRTILIGDYPKDAAEVVVPDVYGVLGALSGEPA